MNAAVAVATREDYARIFETERQVDYPIVSALEARCGFALDRDRLEDAARVLACPFKKSPPNWQHGRVLYAIARQYLVGQSGPVSCVDIGTAKGFSALCLLWALQDAGVVGRVTTVDVLDPASRVRRNTVAECDGYLSLFQTLEPWTEAKQLDIRWGTGADVLKGFKRVHLAYVDGKHTYDAVSTEIGLLRERQEAGDRVVFDDVQIDGVAKAVKQAQKHYEIEYLDVLPNRRYALAVRRG